MKCYVNGYDKSKHETDANIIFFDNLGEVNAFEVVHGQEELKARIGWTYKDADPMNEYLVIYLANGRVTSYCNSMVDIFEY